MKLCDHCGACYEDEFDLCAYEGNALRHAFEGTRVLHERYRLDARLAGGGMGEVYRATHVQIGSTVAVKLMRQDTGAGGPRRIAVARFHREAMILGQIKHPNAVLVMDFGVERRATRDIPFLVTEFLSGEPLSRRLAQKKRLALAEAERIVTPLADAVEEAHRIGVVHRDIKPSNVFLERVGDGSEIVKVLDFGIARFMADAEPFEHAAIAAGVEAEEGDTRPERILEVHDTFPDERAGDTRDTLPGELTSPGAVLGTIAYMAPEQLLGEAATPRTDVYAIAVLLFELLAGEVPFTGPREEIMRKKLAADAALPLSALRNAGVPAAIQSAIKAALSRDPAQRPDNARALAAALRDSAFEPKGLIAREPALALAVQLGALTSAIARLNTELESWTGRALDELSYQRARDRILTLDLPLSRAMQMIERCPPALAAEGRLLKEVEDFAEAIETTARSLRLLTEGAPESEYLRFLSVLGARQVGAAAALDRRVRQRLSLDVEPELALEPAQSRLVLEELTARLLSTSELLSADAMDAVFHEHLALVREPLERAAANRPSGPGSPNPSLPWTRVDRVPNDPLVSDLVLGLWAHADTLLLRELFPIGGAAPGLLASLSAFEPFATLARLFTAAEPVPAEGERMLHRCALLHPSTEVRARAAAALPLSELWTAVTYPETPILYLGSIFERFLAHGSPEHAKIFFFCARDRLAAAEDRASIAAAFAILAHCLALPAFRDESVQASLLAADDALRVRCAKLGIAVPAADGYAEKLAAFAGRAPDRAAPPENMADIPLTVHREAARRGVFISFYVTHSVDAIARETLPYLLKLDDVTPYLQIPSINRSVLVTLARQQSFFRKEAARLALVQNPKTPLSLARRWMPFLSLQQLSNLVGDRSLGADVRELAKGYVQKLRGVPVKE